MKRLLLSFLGISLLSYSIAQTNVSGGIYSNTTWTKANSPYIVTDTIVVFPGVTLTIQPGVTVKFADNKRIEFRQAKLIANAASTDSITFTSNSSSPTPGIYAGIYLNGGNLTSTFNYCNFRYAIIGINVNVTGSLTVNNSNFKQNLDGLYCIGTTSAANAIIDSTVFNNNTNGLILGFYSSKINYCNFSYNSTNGMLINDGGSPTITNCNFYNNATGMLWNTHNLIVNHCNLSNNTTGFQSNEYFSKYDTYSITMKNSIVNLNQTGIANVGYTLVDSCTINHNQTGSSGGGTNTIKNSTIDSNSVLGIAAVNDQVINCNIKYNGAGIQVGSGSGISSNRIEYNTGANISCGAGTTTITGNTIRYGRIGIDNTAAQTLIITKNIINNNGIGINLISPNTTISYNKICNNTTYDLKYGASNNIDASHNCWCALDSTSTEAMIYDGYDNINYGLVNFMPIDTGCSFIATGIPSYESPTFSFSIFPNPATDNLTIELPVSISKAEIKIFNTLGELEYSSIATKEKMDVDVSSFSRGVYFIQIVADNKSMSRQKFIKQ